MCQRHPTLLGEEVGSPMIRILILAPCVNPNVPRAWVVQYWLSRKVPFNSLQGSIVSTLQREKLRFLPHKVES